MTRRDLLELRGTYLGDLAELGERAAMEAYRNGGDNDDIAMAAIVAIIGHLIETRRCKP